MWSPYSIINYDDDIGGTWGSPGHANGVIMQDGWITGGFNALNQPMYIWAPNTTGWTYFAYDPLGRCVKRWRENAGTTYLYYDGWNLIQEGPDSSIADRLYVHGARVDEVVAQITPSNNWIRYFHYDANGNCTLQTYGWGNIVEQYDYDAFGYPYFYDAWGNNIGYSPWGNRFLFTGREWLSELKLYDYRNRLYNPELGRFMQPDPKEFAAGDFNLYRYCHNDPVNKTDPTGLAETEIIAKIVKMLRGVKDSEKTVKELHSMKDAVRALKQGEDVRFRSATAAREAAKEAGGGKPPIRETDKFGSHYHDANRAAGHALFGSAGIATIRDALPPEATGVERVGASVLDFFNPILIVNDLIDIAKSIPFQGIADADAAREHYPPR